MASALSVAALAVGAVSLAAPAHAQTLDDEQYPNVVDVPAGQSKYTGTGTAMIGGSSMALPVGSVPAGTAKVLGGTIVNSSATDQCLVFSARSSGFLELSPTSTALTLLGVAGLKLPPSAALPGTLAPRLTGADGRISDSTSDWECTKGTLVAAGDSLDYSITVGVPLGGTAVTDAKTKVLAYVEAAPRFDQSWNDGDYDGLRTLNSTNDLDVVNTSDPRTTWGGMSLGRMIPGGSLGVYGVVTNDLSYPVRVSFAGYSDSGTEAPFLAGTLSNWPGAVELAPGETTEPFLMKLGMPYFIGNESTNTSAQLAFTWDVEPVPTSAAEHTVTFDANGGSGGMPAQTGSESAPLATSTFTRDGWTFTGWNTAADGSGTTFEDGADYAFDADLDLFAQWVPAKTPKVTPSDEPTEATSTPEPSTPEPSTPEPSTTAATPVAPAPTVTPTAKASDAPVSRVAASRTPDPSASATPEPAIATKELLASTGGTIAGGALLLGGLATAVGAVTVAWSRRRARNNG